MSKGKERGGEWGERGRRRERTEREQESKRKWRGKPLL